MEQEKINRILAEHEKWVSNEGCGVRANFRCADLRDANLWYANLQDANLRGADLRGVDLRGADLRDTDLRDAIGIILLPVQDMRGYSFAHAIECEAGWRVRVGCRYFTISEAKKHWGENYGGDREQGDMYLYAIEWLEKKLERMQ